MKAMQAIQLATATEVARKAKYDADTARYNSEWRAMETDDLGRKVWGAEQQNKLDVMAVQLDKLQAEASSATTTAAQLQEALRLQREGQQLINRATKAGLPEAEAAARMWENLGEIGKEAGMLQRWVSEAAKIINMFSDRTTTITRK